MALKNLTKYHNTKGGESVLFYLYYQLSNTILVQTNVLMRSCKEIHSAHFMVSFSSFSEIAKNI